MSDNLLFSFLINKHVFIDNLDYMPFSILALEAMALGLILIVSDDSGISSYINNGENGFVYNSESPEEISEILNDIFAGKYDLDIISKNAKKIYEQLNWDKVAQQYLEAYKTVL
jgi:glycosyltransferase involved in cell wall biosynthesis